MTAELRRSIFLACVGLLGGFALVVTLYGASVLFKHGINTGGDRTALLAPVAEPAVKSVQSPGDEASVTPGKPAPEQPAEPKPASPPESRPASPKSGVQASAPTFDIIRVEPSGEAVIAGRAAPNTTVELLRDGEPLARALVDPSGQFAIVPPALATGSSELTLRSTGADGRPLPSRESVAVVVSPERDAKPLVALTSPDKPTVVLSQPDARAERTQVAAKAEKDLTQAELKPPRAGGAEATAPVNAAERGKTSDAKSAEPAEGTVPVKIVSVEAEEGGRLYVTGKAQPGATVRLYLNDTAVAPGSVGADGRFAFTIGRGVQPGAYAIRVDEVDPVSARVKTRSEVPFTVPAPKSAAKVALLTPPVAESLAPRAGIAKLPQALAVPPATPSIAPAPVRASMATEPKANPAPKSVPQVEAKAEASSQAEVEAKAETSPQPKIESKPGTTAQLKVDTKADPAPRPEGPPAVFVPEIGTARIVRGDSLWQISRRIYGRGTRYTVIYDANQPQIRNPDRIFPGQIFVLPSDGTTTAAVDDKRG